VWAARDDGLALAFTYQREHLIEGWTRHDTGDGDEIVDVCCIPEGEETAVYWTVRRSGIGAGPRYYIERMATRQVPHAADGKFLDSFRFYEDANADAGATYTLGWNGQYWLLRALGTTPDWTYGPGSPDIGRVILLYGPGGERVWCTVTNILAVLPGPSYRAVCTVRTDVPAGEDANGDPLVAIEDDGSPGDLFPFDISTAISTWSQSTQTITDLWHLEGREVYAVADGYPLGPFTVEDGTITLDVPYVLVVVGLQIIADLVTLEPENPDTLPSWVDREKTIGDVVVRVQETDGLSVGLSVKSLESWSSDWMERDTFAEGFLYTGRLTVHNEAVMSPTGRIFLRQAAGLPTAILGVYPQVDVGDN
jgi:hypothetical protein